MGVQKYTTNTLPWFFAKFYSAPNIFPLSSLDCSGSSHFFFTTFCLCRNIPHFLTSGVEGHQDLIAQKCNQIQAASSYLTAHNFLQHLCFYKLSKTMKCGFKAWQKDLRQICPRATCPVQGQEWHSLILVCPLHLSRFCDSVLGLELILEKASNLKTITLCLYFIRLVGRKLLKNIKKMSSAGHERSDGWILIAAVIKSHSTVLMTYVSWVK